MWECAGYDLHQGADGGLMWLLHRNSEKNDQTRGKPANNTDASLKKQYKHDLLIMVSSLMRGKHT